MLVLSLDKEPHLKRMYNLAQNPRSTFVIEGLTALIALVLSLPEMPKIIGVVETSLFSKKKLNNHFFNFIKKTWKIEVQKLNGQKRIKKEILFFMLKE